MRKKAKTYTVHINGGYLKGKKIEIPAAETTRSSKTLLKKSFFDTVQFDITDKIFIEVFAGSGSVAIEALSRGAYRAWCIEKDRDSFEILRRNAAVAEKGSMEIIHGDSFEILPSLLKRIGEYKKEFYIYFDPPFSIREGMEDIYEKTLSMMELLDPELCDLCVLEYMSGVAIQEKIGGLLLNKNKRFGKSSLAYYLPKRKIEEE